MGVKGINTVGTHNDDDIFSTLIFSFKNQFSWGSGFLVAFIIVLGCRGVVISFDLLVNRLC